MIAAAVMAGVFVPGQPAWAVPDTEAGSESPEPELDRGPDGLQAPDAASALTIARLEGEKVEVLGERTEMSSTWAMPDGTLTTGQAAAPVWVRQGDGDGTAAADWAPVDLTLVVTPEGDIAPVSFPGELSLAGEGVPESGALVTLTGGDGEQVSIAWTEDLPEPVLAGPRATYEDVQPGVDMVVEATRTGYEQFFVLTEAPADPAALDLSLQVRTEGLEASADADGGVLFTDADGEVAGHSGTPLVWDAEVDAQRQHPITEPFVVPTPVEGTLSSGMSPVPDWGPAPASGEPSITPQGTEGSELVLDGPVPPLPGEEAESTEVPADAGQASSPEEAGAGASVALPLTTAAEIVGPGAVDLELTPDESYLASPETTYPVVIDPDGNLTSGFDTFVQTGFNSDQSGSTELRIGSYNGGANVARSFINIDLSAIRYKTVLHSQLDLYMFHSYSCSPRSWQVFNTGLADNSTRINNQPWWGSPRASSDETRGYSGSCGEGYVSQNLTSVVHELAQAGIGWTGFGIRAISETDSYAWKKFNSTNAGWGIPVLYVNWNTPPGPANDVWISHANKDSDNRWWITSATPQASAVVNDADGVADLYFEVRRASDGAVIWPVPGTDDQRAWARGVPNGARGGVNVPPGFMADGSSYFIRAHTHDGVTWNVNHADGGVFTVDTTAPAAPRVASTDYPADGTWHGSETTPGAFTLTMPAADGTLSGYEWGMDATPSTKVAASGNTTLTITPPTAGSHVLQVRSIDKAGNRSGIVRYLFNVGRAGLISPLEGSQVVRNVRLTATGEPVFTHVQYVWRRGPDSGTETVIPLSALSKADGSSVSTLWTPLPAADSYLTWNAGITLGDVPGPVQVAARMATDNTGAGAYTTAWTTVTVTPDASYAATDSVGPGTVNLLTGDYGLSATDVDEFGLALGRTASSRDPRSGFELQPEILSQSMQTMSAVNGYISNGLTLSQNTGRYHQGKNSLQLTSNGQSADSFATPATELNLRRGATFRVSAWIYVPSSTGLVTDPTAWAQKLNVYYLSANEGYKHSISTMPAIADAWQQITMDVTIPAGAASDGQLRLYSGSSTNGNIVYYDDVSVREIWAPLGPQWSLGTADGTTDTAYSHISQPDPDVAALHLSGGGEIWFTRGSGDSWWPEPGAEGLTLSNSAPGTWTLREIDGTVSTFGPAVGTDTIARLAMSSPPAAAGQTRLVYETVNGRIRLTRLIAPVQPGVDNWPTNTAACTTATPAAGCQVQELVYAAGGTPSSTTSTSFGNYADRLVEVKLWSSTPTQAMSAVSVVRYAYDDKGMLREVWDPRITPALKTAYTYDGSGRVLTITGAGELPWRFTYGTGGSRSTIGNGDLIDRSSGRLLSVTRASLQQGSNTTTGPDNTSTIVYNVPLSRSAGGPYDLNAAALATWAQTRGPTDGTAIFGPEDVPTVTTATSTTPGANGYKPAVVHYLDASGREVNTAAPGGPNAPAAGFIDTAEYDRFGNVVRSLDATNRLLALGQLPTASADLAALNLTNADTATRATALSGVSTYSADGLDLTRTRGPLLRLSIGNNPNDIRLGHRVTTNVYDEGKPDGAAYHLLTTTTDAVLVAGSSPEQFLDAETSVNGYDPIDGASPLGPTSGWVIGSPTVVTGDAGSGGANLVSRVRYDAQGRAVESRKVGSTGADAGTVRSVFYTAGANPDRADCGNNPHYAGLPCATFAAGASTGSDTARMSTGLPVRTVTVYNRYGSIAEVRESATGPLAGSTVTQSRTTTTTYDDADRVTSVAMTTTGAGVTPSALPKTVTTYDPASGDALIVSTVDANGTEIGRVEKTFDQLGRMTRYVDATGAWTNTSFDRYGKPITVTDSTGSTTTFVYDRTVEPRGYVTSVTDSVGGTISATYGPDGQLLTQSMPGGVQLRIAYDAASTPISRTYVRTSDNAVVSSSAVVENGNGQYVSHTTPASTKTFTYDRLGRLTGVTDLTAGIAKCTSRAYTYGDRAQRLTKATNQSANSTCPTATGSGSTSVSYSYDTADRLVSDSRTGAAGWVYDPLGRIVDAPVDSAPGSRVQNTFWANDLIATQTITNVTRQSWTLDPIKRFNEFTSETWMNNAWQQAVTKVNHYDSDSDSPSWIAEDKSLPTEITRFVDGLDGSMAMQTGKTGSRVLQLIDLQGSVMTTLPIADGATTATWTAIRHQTADEYGAPTSLTTGARAASTGAAPGKNDRYGWLGGAQRSAQALAGVMLMGVRLYDPATGRFWSTDPVPGGNSTTYDYCSADPINCTDLDGQWGWFKKLVKKAVKVAAVVGEVASNIPGPIGAAAAGISAVAYAAQGNKSKAIEMGITAAAAMIPGGGAIVRAGARAIRAAGSVAGKAGRAAAKVVRKGGSSCRRNSFTSETQVQLANGTHIPIADISVGDMVLAADPQTGVVTSQAVIDVIVGYGERHLYRISVGPDEGLVADAWTATSSHEVWVADRGWTEVGDLRRGDSLIGSDGSVVTVSNVQDQGILERQHVFNLTVANVHTYFVGDGDGSLVHNCGDFVGDAAGRSNDELARLAYAHSGEGFANGARRPSLSEITNALNKGSRNRQYFPNGGSSVRVERGNVRVHVNEVNANRSTAYYIDRRPKRRR